MPPETHPFEIFITDTTRSLIIGTFPCLDFVQNDYGHWFYSTNNKNLLWAILSNVFGQSAIDRQQKEKLLLDNNIGMADIATRIQRAKSSCADTDFTIIEPNKILLKVIFEKKDLTLYFTSSKAQMLTDKYYFETFNNKIQNRKINLLSPSKSASRSIARTLEYKSYITENPSANTLTFRLKKYSELLK